MKQYLRLEDVCYTLDEYVKKYSLDSKELILGFIPNPTELHTGNIAQLTKCCATHVVLPHQLDMMDYGQIYIIIDQALCDPDEPVPHPTLATLQHFIEDDKENAYRKVEVVILEDIPEDTILSADNPGLQLYELTPTSGGVEIIGAININDESDEITVAVMYTEDLEDNLSNGITS